MAAVTKFGAKKLRIN